MLWGVASCPEALFLIYLTYSTSICIILNLSCISFYVTVFDLQYLNKLSMGKECQLKRIHQLYRIRTGESERCGTEKTAVSLRLIWNFQQWQADWWNPIVSIWCILAKSNPHVSLVKMFRVFRDWWKGTGHWRCKCSNFDLKTLKQDHPSCLRWNRSLPWISSKTLLIWFLSYHRVKPTSSWQMFFARPTIFWGCQLFTGHVAMWLYAGVRAAGCNSKIGSDLCVCDVCVLPLCGRD